MTYHVPCISPETCRRPPSPGLTSHLNWFYIQCVTDYFWPLMSANALIFFIGILYLITALVRQFRETANRNQNARLGNITATLATSAATSRRTGAVSREHEIYRLVMISAHRYMDLSNMRRIWNLAMKSGRAADISKREPHV